MIDNALGKADTNDLKFELMSMKLPALANASLSPAEIEQQLMSMFDLSEGISVQARAMKLISASRIVHDLFIEDKITEIAVVERAKNLVAPSIAGLPALNRAVALDSLAHLQFVTGDLAGAISSQEKAVELTKDKQQATYQKFLDQLKSTNEEGAAEKKGSGN